MWFSLAQGIVTETMFGRIDQAQIIREVTAARWLAPRALVSLVTLVLACDDRGPPTPPGSPADGALRAADPAAEGEASGLPRIAGQVDRPCSGRRGQQEDGDDGGLHGFHSLSGVNRLSAGPRWSST